MIMTDKGTIEMNGKVCEIRAEFATLIYALLRKQIVTPEDVAYMTVMAMLSVEETRKKEAK